MSRENHWLLNPVLDFLLVGGGLVWLMAAAALFTPDFDTGNSRQYLLLLGSVILTTTHFGLPVFARCKTPAMKLLLKPAAIAFLVINVIAALCSQTVLSYLLQFYLCAVVLHYSVQNVQVAKMYLRRAGFEPGRAGSFALQLFPSTLALWSLTRQMEVQANLASFQGVQLPPWPMVPPEVPTFLLATSITSAVVFLIIVGVRSAQYNRMLPPSVLMVLISTSMMFCVTGNESSLVWVFAPIFMHAIQSIALHISESKAKDKWVLASTVSKSFIFGVGITYCLPNCLLWLGVPEQKAYAAILAVFSFHHFLIEALFTGGNVVSEQNASPDLLAQAEPAVAPGSALPASPEPALQFEYYDLSQSRTANHSLRSVFRSLM